MHISIQLLVRLMLAIELLRIPKVSPTVSTVNARPKYPVVFTDQSRLLKEVYMQRMNRERIDVLIYVLWDMILPDLMQDHLRTVADFQLRKLNLAERLCMKKVTDLNGNYNYENLMEKNSWFEHSIWLEEEASALIVDAKENMMKVASFTREDKNYIIDVDTSQNRMVSCSCFDHQQSNVCCAHVFGRSYAKVYFSKKVLLISNLKYNYQVHRVWWLVSSRRLTSFLLSIQMVKRDHKGSSRGSRWKCCTIGHSEVNIHSQAEKSPTNILLRGSNVKLLLW